MRTRTLPPATHTNAFLVGGSEMVLIDPSAGDPAERERLLYFIERLGGEGRGVGEIWLTHHHPDHVGGLAEVAAALKARVRAHPETARRLNGAGVAVEPDLTDGVTRTIPGRPGWTLRAIHTPGHAPGHIAILEEVAGTLIAGDMVAGVGFILIDPPEGDMAVYLESLRRLRDLPATAIFPSHGPPTAGARARCEEYLAHRLEREARVVQALEGGAPRGLDELLPEVYDDVEVAAHPLARRSLLAHLLKLEREGTVAADGERYRRLEEPAR
jgi:glyoxylase-like metal-dependent hydrolase (beta-lactamase superfamily II)